MLDGRSAIMQHSRPAAKPKSVNWSPAAHGAVFVRNLKLLQLDQQEDWPNISTRTLAPSQQNQRQRVKAVEWALYQLFSIWDPEATYTKLRPFFPPLEPLQSVNLRAALFRALTELKKNGDLGRESVVRKTMLDDCKGEKFEELLAVFSTAVLRKVVATTGLIANPALKVSMASGVTPEEYQAMVPLIIAHQASLSGMAERRERVRQTYEKFNQLLELKRAELTERAKENPVSSAKTSMDVDVAREIRANWLGSAEWATTLLEAGSRSSTDSFLELPFARAWARANESTVEDLTSAPSNDLLVDLELRVAQQRRRLIKWREFRESIKSAEVPMAQRRVGSAKIVFRDHQSLSVASISKTVHDSGESAAPLQKEDEALLASLDQALATINGKASSSRRPVSTFEPRSRYAESRPQSQHIFPPPALLQPDPVLRNPSRERPARGVSPVVHVSADASSDSSLKSDASSDTPELQQHYRPRVNLVERTRKSMSLVLPPRDRPPRESLARSHRPRPSFPVNQFDAQHHLPVDSFDVRAVSRTPTPREELFDEEAEYSSVFKSRPRVVHSPVASPAVHVSPLDLDMVDLPESPLARRNK
ncbi:hypothetical protein ASPZODRAFT_29052 [Penicilliopsis zonata CBS 506.65]|uniref:HAUS augmin-like complex subunit 6 N-terminal domain-containing protein n=1 Tax=Penicilliopsis zonata CBS 506.65 TaxID=1073090 RepID=A0A1L9S6H8_9EURO|nr:hypothetical protein ASPZODRAFT_29052 [Penicilliopsis zonata CBS 506.65]OJJ42733.1 hypothetical protein ASPZODRAFT_29052 [Penicilliopsis zonata CBS 506.65]